MEIKVYTTDAAYPVEYWAVDYNSYIPQAGMERNSMCGMILRIHTRWRYMLYPIRADGRVIHDYEKCFSHA